jgi:hypothetical protein
MEFMNAMQRFKDQAGKSFPTYGEVLQVAYSLGYRKVVPNLALTGGDSREDDADLGDDSMDS